MVNAPTFTQLTLRQEFDPAPRVTIDLDAPDAARVTVWRCTEYERTPAREANDVIVAGGHFFDDYEVPFGVETWWEAEAVDAAGARSVNTSRSESVFLPLETTAMQDVRDPTLTVEVELTSDAITQLALGQSQDVNAVVGQSRPSAVVGVRQAPSGVPLDVYTYTAEEMERLRTLLMRASSVLFRLPASAPKFLTGHYALEVKAEAVDPVALGGQWRWTLVGQQVAAPTYRSLVVIGTYVDFEAWTYEEAEDYYDSYGEIEKSPYYVQGPGLPGTYAALEGYFYNEIEELYASYGSLDAGAWLEYDPLNPGLLLMTVADAFTPSVFPGLYEFEAGEQLQMDPNYPGLALFPGARGAGQTPVDPTDPTDPTDPGTDGGPLYPSATTYPSSLTYPNGVTA
jgi:hypothetical protein